MPLTRYEFEILRFLEKRSGAVLSTRELSDSLCLSLTTVLRCLGELRARGCLDGEFRLTAEGAAALEPYRVKRAIILAAGFGSRMMPATEDRPKPMVTVNGVRIIDTLLDALTGAGITDITLVGGYRFERLQELNEKYPSLRLLENKEYRTTNNISSAMLSLDRLVGGCYLCEADLLITNPELIEKYQYASNILGSYSMETDDWCFKMKDGLISDYQKGNTYCYNYYGISYWTPEDCEKLREDFASVYAQPEGKDCFWEFVPLLLKKERYPVEIRPCRKQDIIEIDNYYELAQIDATYKKEDARA